MTIPPPRNGAVVRYSYLWRTEQEMGAVEGRKDRPAAVILVHTDPATGAPLTYVLPITHVEPSDPSVAVEIPPEVKARLGLDGERSWIVCDEVNRFRWPGPDLRPIPDSRPAVWEYGLLPPGLFRQAKTLFLACRRRGLSRSVTRTT
jgi:hypothetical protein